MLTLLIRTTVLFFFAVLMMRVMGKRQISQLQPFELVIAIMIADLAAIPMGDVGVPLMYGILPMATLMMLHSLLAILSIKSQKMRTLISGAPSVFIKKGVLQESELRKNCYDLNDLLEELRSCGVLSPADVGTAVLETSGKMSVFPLADKRPVSPADLGITVDYEGIPLTLVLDGVVQHQNLTVGGLDENWLKQKLKEFGFSSPNDVFIASLDTQGMFFVQGHGVKPRLKIAKALEPDQVGW